MGTNYYFRVSPKLVKGVIGFLKDKNVSDYLIEILSLGFSQVIHIGKRSYGWKPLFKQTKWYNSVRELKSFYENNKNDLEIINGDEDIIDFKELEKELINWDGGNCICNPGMRKDKYCFRDSDGYEFCTVQFS